jgi:hypothetical protein
MKTCSVQRQQEQRGLIRNMRLDYLTGTAVNIPASFTIGHELESCHKVRNIRNIDVTKYASKTC